MRLKRILPTYVFEPTLQALSGPRDREREDLHSQVDCGSRHLPTLGPRWRKINLSRIASHRAIVLFWYSMWD